MWLPTPVYECLPIAYIVGGVLFVSGALYLGPNVDTAPAYLVLGLISVLSGILIHFRRKQSRQEKISTGSETNPE